MTRPMQWKSIGGIVQRNSQYGGKSISANSTRKEIRAALEDGDIHAYESGGVYGAGKSNNGGYEGEFWRYFCVVDKFCGVDIETAVDYVMKWKKWATK